ncbi:hypothetical protein BJY01DRAFT_230069 [Aspergillus pseudoustus]|uniref:Sensor histidine kinase/response regulator n=1 Tax=Aspergillus pseudoustus TaxID=1810923 RepID=A0ABR4ID99_9EURO
MASDFMSRLDYSLDDWNADHDKDDRVHIKAPAFLKASAYTQRWRDANATDPILTALTQLGAFRIGCHRAFTAIFAGDTPRIIAEARTLSSTAGNKCQEPGSLIDTATLGLERQSDDHSDASNFDGHRVIRDTKLENAALRKHPLLARSQARFYAEIPLHDCSGNLIGTYGVLGRNPRPYFKSHDLVGLYGIAESVAEHLDSESERQRDARSRRQLEALLEIAGGNDGIQATNWGSRKSTSPSGCISPRSSVLRLDSLNLSGTVAQSPVSRPKTTPDSTWLHGAFPEGQDSPPETPQRHAKKPSGEMRVMVTVPEARPIHPHTASVYARASSLLQAGMGADGVLFMTAPRVNSRINSRRSSCASFSDLEGNVGSTDSNRRASSSMCDSMGSAFSERYTMNGYVKPSVTLDEELLHDLFLVFPQGQVLSSIREITTAEPIYHAATNGLFHAFPDASSLIFLPLWNPDKTRWLAASIVWSCDPHRVFEDDDLYYLKVFADMVASEMAQADRSALEKSKSDLLSSMSHELRSPLHGMLANSELLQSTDLDPTQRDMVRMVETCGETLLDTMNCLLDFAKINNLTHAHKGSINTAAHLNSLITEFNLGSLVDDVANSVYAGHQRLNKASKTSGCRSPEEDDETQPHELSVIVRVEDNTESKIRSISGAWRRIIMNVLGNALKFTRSGLIEVVVNQGQRKRHARTSNFAHLKITDTGCGISQDYLNRKLFTPFSQECVLTEGVGLGLSITQQLVEYLGGHIQVKSESGAGTQVDVYIPVDVVEGSSPAQDGGQKSFSDTKLKHNVCLIGLDPHITASEGSQCPSAKRKLAIRSAISGVVSRQPVWNLSFADSFDGLSGEVAVIEQSALISAATVDACRSQFRSVVVLGGYGVSAPHTVPINGVEVIYISQPFGPQKLIQAFQGLAESQPIPIPGPSISTISGEPSRYNSFSKAFDKPKGSDSPPAVRQSVSEYLPLSSEGHSGESLHVLIVDDNDINLKVLSTFLRKIGCTFETASDGLSALQIYKQATRRFDYVLMDISMPVMDGITASSKIREFEEKNGLERSAIMAVTGVASSETQEQAFEAGIDEYLVKPLSLRDLKRILSVP